MGCFCRHIVLPPLPVPDEEHDEEHDKEHGQERTEEPTAPPVIAALSEALAARWLPAATPWEPDPEWLDAPLPTVPMSPVAFSTVMRLVHAREAIRVTLKLDPLQPKQQAHLARIVATLNERSELLEPLADDRRPWSALARVNDQADTVQQALSDGLLEPAPRDPGQEAVPLAQWRPMLVKLKPLLPVIAVVEMLGLDLSDPVTALDRLAVTIRTLRKVALPPLERPLQVMQLIARSEAVTRLQKSMGDVPFEEMRDKVAQKVRAVQEQLPPALAVGPAGQLEGMPPLMPNPSSMINAATVAAASRLNPVFVAGLNWNVSVQQDPPLLTVGVPVAALVKRDPGQVRSSPCDAHCDAAKVLATAWPGSGTGVAPAA